MKALVINLDSAEERMAFQKQQFESLDLSFNRLPAIKINNVQNKLYQNYYNTWQRPMSISEVSCFFSHKNAWDLIIKENQAMVILEDDAFLSKNVPCILKELSELKDIDYVNLEERMNRKKLVAKAPTEQFCESSLFRLYQGRSGAAAYVLWPSGAEKLLQQMNSKGIGIADKFINENYSLLSYQLEPASVIQLDQCQSHKIKPPLKVRSSIQKTEKHSISSKKWLYRLRRIMGEIKIGLNLIRHFHHSERRSIKTSELF